MVTDALLSFVSVLLGWLSVLLPDAGDLNLPDTSGVVSLLADIDSVIPIGPAISLALVLLAAGAAFLVVRFVLLIWKALPLT